jgi:hypothetical protein
MSVTDNDQTTGILTMVSNGLWAREPVDPQEIAADQKREAARVLAPLLKVMREAGMFEPNAGFRVALAGQMPSVDWNPEPPVTSAVTDRLTRARDMISERVTLTLLPEALIIHGHGVMPLLGTPAAGRIRGGSDGSSYEVF